MTRTFQTRWPEFPAHDVQSLFGATALAAVSMALDTKSRFATPSFSDTSSLAMLATLAQSDALTWRQRRSLRQIKSQYMLTDPFKDRRRIAIWLTSALPASRWVRAMDGVRGMFGFRYPGPAEAESLADALAASAWSSAAFSVELGRMTRMHLRSRVFARPALVELPDIADETLWLLAAAWLPRADIALKRRQKDGFLAAFANHARTRATAKGWAGFWDLYLLARMTESGGTLPDATMAAQARAFGADALEPKDGEGLFPHMKATWRRDAPALGVTLLSGTL